MNARNIAIKCSVGGRESIIERIHHQLASSSCQDIVASYLDRIRETEPILRSFITVDEHGAIKQAKQLDLELQQHKDVSSFKQLKPLVGIPVAIKDNIVTKNLQTTAGSKTLTGYIPPYDATAVTRLRDAGAIIIGKTNMDEFGMGSSTENSAFASTKNPRDPSRVPGGSSGGSAAAVAAEQCGVSLGSDTGGSIRQPAHFCGVVGVKPTYGMVSRYGLIAYASSLDVIGPMAPTVLDAANVLSVIAGGDPSRDATSASMSSSAAAGLFSMTQRIKDSFLQPAKESAPLKGRTIGLITETIGEGVDPDVESDIVGAAARLESLGAVVKRVSLPSFTMGLPAYYVIALSEASSNLSRYDGVRYGHRFQVEGMMLDDKGRDYIASSLVGKKAAADLKELYATSRSNLGAEVRRRILMGTYALSAGYYDAYYKRAQQVRTLITREMSAALDDCDALLCPTAPTPAYKLGEKTSDPLAMYKGDLMTVNVNLSGLPAVSMPCGRVCVDGIELPIGMQLIGRAFGEEDLLSIAHIYERAV